MQREESLLCNKQESTYDADYERCSTIAFSGLSRYCATNVVTDDAKNEINDNVIGIKPGDDRVCSERDAAKHHRGDNHGADPRWVPFADEKSNSQRKVKQHLKIEGPTQKQYRLNESILFCKGDEDRLFSSSRPLVRSGSHELRG